MAEEWDRMTIMKDNHYFFLPDHDALFFITLAGDSMEVFNAFCSSMAV